MDLASALDELPEVHAAVLRLHRAGTDAAGIAAELGIEVEAVAPLLRVAEAKLAQLLTAPGPSGRADATSARARTRATNRTTDCTHGTDRSGRGGESPVADYGVISDVSTSLVTLLDQDLRKPPLNARAQLDDLSGTAPAGLTLTVTLYEILEDAPSRNRPRPQQPNGTAAVSTKPPMALRLHYLLTPWGGDPATEQQIVGRAMQALYDDAIFAGTALLGGLQGSIDTLKITLVPLTLEDRARVWYAIQKPYRLSVNYEVRVVNLDATVEQRDRGRAVPCARCGAGGDPAMTPVIFRPLPGQRRVSYSAAWFAPVDLVTGLPPAAPLRVFLDVYRGQAWVPTDIQPTITPSGAIAYPDLGRRRNPAAAEPVRYRARFESDAYLPLDRADRDGEEFLAYPFDDTTPPAQVTSLVTVNLAPAVGYPFPGDLPVLYGEVETAASEPVPDVLLSATVGPPVLRTPKTAWTLTGPAGTFALPLRWAPTGQDITVVAVDYRHTPNRTGQLSVRLPDALGRNQKIVIG